MRILLTNDDGINAPGIKALHDELIKIGTVHTIAPATVQSATSHGVTFHAPLEIHDVRISDTMSGIAVDGRPADCVKLAITRLWEDRYGGKPDLVVSGMNAGTNVGIHVIYSGTIGAAIEGAFLGVPAMAVSLHFLEYGNIQWEVAARHAREVIEKALDYPEESMRSHSILNINLPLTEGKDLDPTIPHPPITIAPMNLAAVNDVYDCQTNGANELAYSIMGDGLDFDHMTEGSDVEALLSNHIVLTPLQYDLTDHARLERWQQHLQKQAMTDPV